MANKDQKRQKDSPKDKVSNDNKKVENKKKGTPLPGQMPKPFQQFSGGNKFGSTNPQKSFTTFHRRSGK